MRRLARMAAALAVAVLVFFPASRSARAAHDQYPPWDPSYITLWELVQNGWPGIGACAPNYDTQCEVRWTSYWALKSDPSHVVAWSARWHPTDKTRGGCTAPDGKAGVLIDGISEALDPAGNVVGRNSYYECHAAPPPSVSLSCPSQVRPFEFFTCSATASAAGYAGTSGSIQWIDINGSRTSGSSATYVGSYVEPGPKTITAVAMDDLGRTGQASVTVTVLPPNQNPNLNLSCPATVNASGGQGTFSCTATASDPDGDTVTVNLEGTTGTATFPSVTASFTKPPGIHTISASARDGKGGTASATATVQVVGDLTVTVSCNPSTVNAGDSTTCTASVTGGKAPYTYAWNNGATGATAVHGPLTQAGTYTASVTVTDSSTPPLQGGGSAVVQVVATGSLTVSVTCTDTTEGGTSDCTAGVAGGNPPYRYAWDNGATSNPATYGPFQTAGTYSASVTVTDVNGLTGTGTGSILVGQACQPDPDMRYISLTLAPNNDVWAGNALRATVTWSGQMTAPPTLTTSWGDRPTMTRQGGAYVATFNAPIKFYRPWEPNRETHWVRVEGYITQPDGCGGTYAGTLSDTDTFILNLLPWPKKPADEPEQAGDEGMVVANFTLQEYLRTCLGELEPWYCGLDWRLVAVYLPDLMANQDAYIVQIGLHRWRKLVLRINRVLAESGQPPSPLYLPPPQPQGGGGW